MQDNCKGPKNNILTNRAFFIFLAIVVIAAVILLLFLTVLPSSEKVPKKATYVFGWNFVNLIL